MAEVIAKSRYVQSAPRKLRAVAKLVKNQTASQSLITLRYTQKKAAGLLAKTIKTAIANAVNNFNLDKDNLVVKSVLIDQGPTLRRMIAMSRGSGNTYKKRTSHITVILYTTDQPTKTVAPAPDASQTTVKSKAKTATATKSTKKTTTSKKKTKTTEQPKGGKTTVSVRSRRAKKEESK